MKPFDTEKQREDYAKIIGVFNRVLEESFGGQMVGRCESCGAIQIQWGGVDEVMCHCNNSLMRARER